MDQYQREFFTFFVENKGPYLIFFTITRRSIDKFGIIWSLDILSTQMYLLSKFNFVYENVCSQFRIRRSAVRSKDIEVGHQRSQPANQLTSVEQ